MIEMADRSPHAGIAVPSISVGSTPTVWAAEASRRLRDPARQLCLHGSDPGLAWRRPRHELALSVLADGRQRESRYAIVDAGSKVLSSDRGPHGSTRLAGYGLATRVSGSWRRNRPSPASQKSMDLSQARGNRSRSGSACGSGRTTLARSPI